MAVQIDIQSEECVKELRRIVENAPQKVNDFMKEVADDYKKNIKEYCHEYDVRKSKLPTKLQTKDRKKVSSKWKEVPKATLTGCNIEIDVYNSHKLFHLLELGHAKYIFGKDTGGFVKGRHLEDRFQEQYGNTFQRKAEEFVNKIDD